MNAQSLPTHLVSGFDPMQALRFAYSLLGARAVAASPRAKGNKKSAQRLPMVIRRLPMCAVSVGVYSSARSGSAGVVRVSVWFGCWIIGMGHTTPHIGRCQVDLNRLQI